MTAVDYEPDYFNENGFVALVGRNITGVWWSEEYLTFETDAGRISYTVDGDCCSTSYFHDLIGLDKLLSGPVVSTNVVELGSANAELDEDALERDSYTLVYGYQIVTEHPMWGEVTTAISFRNDNNGYYGGHMSRHDLEQLDDTQRLLTADVTGS